MAERNRQGELSNHCLMATNLPGARSVTLSTLTILSGDLNFKSTPELEYLTSQSFHDTITTTSMGPAVEDRGSATIGVTFPIKSHNLRRSDFILFKSNGNWQCTHHTYFANDPIRDSNGNVILCEHGRNGALYPSDHLGVFAEFTRTS